MLWGARTSSASIEWPTSSEARPNSSSVSRLRGPPELHISAPAHEKYRGWWRFGGEMQRSWRPRRNSKVSKPASQSIPVNPPFHPSFEERCASGARPRNSKSAHASSRQTPRLQH